MWLAGNMSQVLLACFLHVGGLFSSSNVEVEILQRHCLRQVYGQRVSSIAFAACIVFLNQPHIELVSKYLHNLLLGDDFDRSFNLVLSASYRSPGCASVRRAS